MGLGLLRALTPARTVPRYEKRRPGELVHLDVKKLGRFRRPGHRVTGVKAGYHRSRGAGWDFVHACIDDHSRPAETAAGLAAAWYRGRGVRIRRVLTDNGLVLRFLGGV